MSDRTQDLTNLRKVATACKNYTDTQIANAKEEIYWHIGEYSVTTSDDNTSASVKTVPSNATRCKIKRVYGNTQKFNPTTASDSTSAMMKTMPSTVYDFDVSKVEGASEVSENLLYSLGTTTTTQGLTFDVNNGNINVSGTPTSSYAGRYINSYLPNNSLAGTYTLANFTNDFPANCFLRLTFEKNGSRVYTFTLGASRQSSTYTFDGTETSFVLEYAFQNSTLTTQNGNIKPMLVKDSTAPTTYEPYFDGIHNFAWTGVKVYDSDNVEQVSKTIDLSTILYNGNPLFEGNSLKAVNDVKDSVTPYKATKKVGSRAYQSGDEEDTSVLTDGTTTLYELATPIEVSINWASTLRGITGYSNGTITLLNTYNMDTSNLITYNSIIKENCCSKIVQTRGGNVVKTINLPTQASDGYSAGSVSNVRDFTTNKRIGNVSKENNLGTLDYTYVSANEIFRTVISGKATSNIQLCVPYETTTQQYSNMPNKTIRGRDTAYSNTNYIFIKDTTYTDATTFKTAMANEPLYYELADDSKTETSIDSVDNIIEVQAGDELAFYDSNDNLVTVPTDLTYRIEVAN